MKKAFTLIELVIVIGIIMVLLTAGIHSLGLVSRYNNSKAIEEIASNIKYTRNLAISKRTDVFIMFNGDNTYNIKGENINESFDYPKEITDNIGTKTIAFNLRGSPHYGSSQTFTFYTKHKNYQIIILPVTGDVYVK